MADDTNVPTQLAESSDEIVRLREREQDLLMKLEQDACEIERLRAALWLASEAALIEIADPADTSVDDVVLHFLEEAAHAGKAKKARRG